MDVAGLELDKDKKYSLAHALAGVIRYALLMRDWKMVLEEVGTPDDMVAMTTSVIFNRLSQML